MSDSKFDYDTEVQIANNVLNAYKQAMALTMNLETYSWNGLNSIENILKDTNKEIAIKYERNHMRQIISNIYKNNFNTTIMKHIVEYSMGYMVQCGHCTEEIVINNIFDLNQYIDCNKNRICWYKKNAYNTNNEFAWKIGANAVFMDREWRIFFCNHCTSAINTLQKLNVTGDATFNLRKILTEIQIMQQIINKTGLFNKCDEITYKIAELAVGYIAKCCNQKCQKTIFIDNEIQLSDNALYIYKVSDTAPRLQTDEDIKTNRFELYRMYGKNYRLFCGDCIYTLSTCRMDTNYCRKDIEKVCMKHPFCGICNRYYNVDANDENVKIMKCINCGNGFCSEICGVKCDSLCKICALSMEYNGIYNAVFSVLDCFTNIQANIVRLITDYSIGIVVNCMVEHCNKEISCKNRFEFDGIKINTEGNKIINYMPSPKTGFQTVNIFGKQRRIFCHKCFDCGSITICNELNCNNYEDDKYAVTCGIHPQCYLCHQLLDTDCVKNCTLCNYFICTNCSVSEKKRKKRDGWGVYSTIETIFCRICLNTIEHNKISNALRGVLSDDFDADIIEIMTQLSMGIAVSCMALKCNKTVICNNKARFYIDKVNEQHNTIIHYQVKNSSPRLPCKLIYGKQTRIFCNECLLHKLRKCSRCDNLDEFSYCANHNLCYISTCNNSAYSTCKLCEKYCCGTCKNEYICKQCINKKRSNEISDSILEAVQHNMNIFCIDINIPDIISMYAIGIVANCMLCGNELVTNDRFEVDCKYSRNSMNCTKDIICYDAPEMSSQITVILYGTKKRIFCSICKVKLKRCEVCKYPNTNYDIYKICGKHPSCYICNGLVSKTMASNPIHQRVCKTCFPFEQLRRMKKLISKLLVVITKDTKIINILSEYSRGIVVDCMVTNCNEKIVINNYDELMKMKMNHYCLSNNKIQSVKTISLFGKQRRIFCSICLDYGNVKQCKYIFYKTHKQQSAAGAVPCKNYDENSICYDHIELYKGHETAHKWRDRCSQRCWNRICKHCSINDACYECIISNEYKEMKNVLFSALKNVISNNNIISMLNEYAVGYVILCSNKYCNSEIVIDDQTKLISPIQFCTRNGYKNLENVLKLYEYYQYVVDEKYVKELKEGIHFIYGKYRAIFCSNCTENNVWNVCGFRHESVMMTMGSYWLKDIVLNDVLLVKNASDEKWYLANVKSIRDKTDGIIIGIHYIGWDIKFDEMIHIVFEQNMRHKIRELPGFDYNFKWIKKYCNNFVTANTICYNHSIEMPLIINNIESISRKIKQGKKGPICMQQCFPVILICITALLFTYMLIFSYIA
eukprot:234770_1